MKIYVSGLYAGGNPQPGVGIVRSLRQGYPNATIVGVEYSNRVSGIHFGKLDELWIQRPWSELDLDAYGEKVREALDAGGLWISGSDLEAMWLASVFPDGHPNLLAPPMSGIKRITKPVVEAASGLPIKIPTYLSTEHSDWDLHAFCREHNWRVWLKGPYYDASRTPTWDTFTAVRNALSKVWSTEKLFLQAHVSGYEESVMLSAFRGELLGAVSMRKRDITTEGKTWAGDVSEVPASFMEPLRQMVRDTNWTGGGELEMVRDASDQLWLIEMNPRFPAWVHGATIAGHNLPALLVQAATRVAAQPVPAVASEFTRIVLEVPVRPDYPLPPLPEPFAGAVGHSMKHPSGLTSLAARLHEIDPHMLDVALAPDAAAPPSGVAELPDTFVADIAAQDFDAMQTPQYIYMDTTATSLFKRAADRAHSLSTNGVEVISGYSIKTNPDKRLIKLALDNGFYAEAISLGEVQSALEVGFRPDQVILNGPGKWWPEGLMPRETMHAVFCDSIADLDRVVAAVAAGDMSAKHIGVRIRTPNITSRFGIPLDSPTTFAKLIAAVKRLPNDSAFGVHFHMASSHVGVAQWWHLFESMLRWCQSIEKLSGRTIEMLDMGGGWYPDDWHEDQISKIARAAERVRTMLLGVRQIASEPGKAMAQPSMALAMRILEIQEHEDDYIEAVVDASIAEIPMHFWQPHRMVRQCAETGELQPIGRGKTHLMGRLCMEHDIIASNVQLPEGTRAGDLLIFCDAGGYDRSMSYVFGRG
ncbi:ATP-grasp domain-containing protein [Sphingomonas xinjiangensis]|uniref:Diaminopimelate decarboxylase n=1 Tax=Sphingomonas xinjiangensis TaxID=643568 RepID=A0A840YRX0_9SPHN|nr:ATP-grasp domain-containing protein [Sphingomonas xinjiangensis]MBB5712420.1 diaminopimelate decarboxylase [Sphingomonas xinjiangensis]